MRATLVRRDGVDFVDDQRPRGRQHPAPGLRAQQHVERFRRRHQDVRRAAAHSHALGGRRISRSHPGADLDIRQPAAPKAVADARQRRLQVAVNVVRQRLERRYVDHLGLVGQPPIETLADQFVDRREEGRERLAGAGRGGDQGVAAGLDRGPGLGLSGGRRAEAVREPRADGRVEQLLDGRLCSRRNGDGFIAGAMRPDRSAAGSRVQGRR